MYIQKNNQQSHTMTFLNTSLIRKTTLFLAAVMLPLLAMALDFNQTQSLVNQGYSDAPFNLGVMGYDGQGKRKDYIESSELYQKADDRGDTRTHKVLAINITMAKVCVKIISKQLICIRN